jgi:hypothetical protein
MYSVAQVLSWITLFEGFTAREGFRDRVMRYTGSTPNVSLIKRIIFNRGRKKKKENSDKRKIKEKEKENIQKIDK